MDEPTGLLTVVAEEGRAEELLELLNEMAAAAKLDDGCEVYAVHRSRRQQDLFFVYELYRDVEAFKLHQANPTLRELGGRLGDLTTSIDVTGGNLVGGDRARRS